MSVGARVVSAWRILTGAIGVAGVLFLLETWISHLLAAFGFGWDSVLSLSLWVAHLGLYLGAGVAVGLGPAAASFFGPMSEPREEGLRALGGWLLLALYATLLLGPRLYPVAGPSAYALIALPVVMVGLLAVRSRAPGSWRARVLETLLRGGLAYLAVGSLLNLRVLGGSIFLARNLALNLLILLGCLAGAAGLARLRGQVRPGRLAPVALIAAGLYVALFLVAGRATDRPEMTSGSSPGAEGGPAEGSAAGAPDRPDLLLVIIDSLRADRLGCYGYPKARTPNLDGLAARATRYADHSASSPWTYPSVASILTGHSPTAHQATMVTRVLSQQTDRGRFGARPLRADLPTLATVLEAAGYETALIATNPYLTGIFGFSRGFDHYQVLLRSGTRYVTLSAALAGVGRRPLEPLDPTLDARAMTDRFIGWFDRPRSRPLALVAHYMDPHFPYRPPERFRQGTGTPPVERVRPIERLSDLYDGEVAYVDEQLGRLLRHLEESGRLARTVVAVTSDHGETFLDHGQWVSWEEMPDGFDPFASRGVDHGQSVYQELLRVPFLLYRPGVPAAVVERPSRAVDLLPTVLAALGLTAPEGLEGEVIGRSPTPPPALSEALLSGLEKKSWREGPLKLIFKPDYPPDAQLELYDLAADPGERRDLALARPAEAAAMRGALERYLEAIRATGGADALTLDPVLLERLKALGYVR